VVEANHHRACRDGGSVRRGQHAADDGSFAKSASVNAGRGAVIIGLALLVGFFLLKDLDDGGGGTQVVSNQPDITAPDDNEPLPTIATTTTLPIKAPKDVKVLVVNGTTVAGAAARVAQPLKVAGYNVLRAVDASPAVKAATKTSSVFYVTKEFEREAKALQSALALPATPITAVPTPPPAAEATQANVVIVVGPDLAKAGPGASSTTVRGGVTTTTRRSTTTTD
jgi:hypothetical protein